MGNWIHFEAQGCQKYALHKKKSSKKSCLKLNFVHKIPRAQMSIFPTSGGGGFKDQYI